MEMNFRQQRNPLMDAKEGFREFSPLPDTNPFRPAKEFDIGGPGIARKIELPDGMGNLIERYRDDDHPPFGPHINMEIILPGVDRKPIIDNHHIL